MLPSLALVIKNHASPRMKGWGLSIEARYRNAQVLAQHLCLVHGSKYFLVLTMGLSACVSVRLRLVGEGRLRMIAGQLWLPVGNHNELNVVDHLRLKIADRSHLAQNGYPHQKHTFQGLGGRLYRSSLQSSDVLLFAPNIEMHQKLETQILLSSGLRHLLAEAPFLWLPSS